MLTPLSIRRFNKNLLNHDYLPRLFQGEALLLCPWAQLGQDKASQAPAGTRGCTITSCLAKTRTKSPSNYGTLALVGQVPVEPTKLASLRSEPG